MSVDKKIGETRTYKTTEAINHALFVCLNDGEAQLADASTTPYAVSVGNADDLTTLDTPSGGNVTVAFDDFVEITAGVAISKGQLLTAGADGKAAVWSNTKRLMGVAQEDIALNAKGIMRLKA